LNPGPLVGHRVHVRDHLPRQPEHLPQVHRHEPLVRHRGPLLPPLLPPPVAFETIPELPDNPEGPQPHRHAAPPLV
jgi:hypothetical protein